MGPETSIFGICSSLFVLNMAFKRFLLTGIDIRKFDLPFAFFRWICSPLDLSSLFIASIDKLLSSSDSFGSFFAPRLKFFDAGAESVLDFCTSIVSLLSFAFFSSTEVWERLFSLFRSGEVDNLGFEPFEGASPLSLSCWCKNLKTKWYACALCNNITLHMYFAQLQIFESGKVFKKSKWRDIGAKF